MQPQRAERGRAAVHQHRFPYRAIVICICIESNKSIVDDLVDSFERTSRIIGTPEVNFRGVGSITMWPGLDEALYVRAGRDLRGAISAPNLFPRLHCDSEALSY